MFGPIGTAKLVHTARKSNKILEKALNVFFFCKFDLLIYHFEKEQIHFRDRQFLSEFNIMHCVELLMTENAHVHLQCVVLLHSLCC